MQSINSLGGKKFETVPGGVKWREGIKNQATRKAGLTKSEKITQSQSGEKSHQ